MKKIVVLFLVLTLCVSDSFSPSYSKKEDEKSAKSDMSKKKDVKERTFKVRNEKEFKNVEKTESKNTKQEPATSVADKAAESDELIPVNVKNEFNEEIRVKLDKNREYNVGPNEWITLGERKPGRYTLSIYNKKGDFVDNLTKDIDKKNKFVLNERTVSNSGKITGLSTGQKVAITAGAIGAAALGTALIGKALMGGDAQEPGEYIPPQETYVPPAVNQVAQNIAPAVKKEEEKKINAFAPGGKAFKFLNTKYEEVTLVVEGTDGNSIGNNWVIPKASAFGKPQPLVYSGEKITLNPNQKVKVILPDGSELQRNVFELDTDILDSGSYVWVIK